MPRKTLKYLMYCLLLIGSSFSYSESLIPCGWGVMNLHEKNANLVGFATQQFPDGAKNPRYEDAHPYLVVFIFKSGPAHFVYYSPSGQALGGDWEEINGDHWAHKNMQATDQLWHECRGTNLEYKPNNRVN